jgi:hypothetical protein
VKIADYIRNDIFLPRLKRSSVLVVYDPQKRYRQVVESLEGDKCQVVFADESTIMPRQEAQKLLLKLGTIQGREDQLLVYIDRNTPETEEDKQQEPFSYFSEAGDYFPKGDGETFHALCRRAKPGHQRDIDKLFEQGEPEDFNLVDRVDAGQNSGWPRLKQKLNQEEPRALLYSFLAPNDEMRDQLNESDDWIEDAKDFFKRVMGLKLISRGRKWDSLAQEAWRYLLFSEFVLDLPENCPEELENVPHAPEEYRDTIYDTCARLRDSASAKVDYVDRSREVAKELRLKELSVDIEDLGVRDTFEFEERSFLARFVSALSENKISEARDIARGHSDSIWAKEQPTQHQWLVANKSLELLQAIQDLRQASAHPPADYQGQIDVYLGYFRLIDKIHRSLQQSIEDLEERPEAIEKLQSQVISVYDGLASDYTKAFVASAKDVGWPPQDLPSNADTYQRHVAPALSDRDKVAYFMVDSLRYELGVELKHLLEKDFNPELFESAAQLPTITPVGMASLLPDAGDKLSLDKKGDDLVPVIDGDIIKTPPQRFTYFKKVLGDRVHMVTLDDLKTIDGNQIPEETNLLYVRSTEIDLLAETDPLAALREIPRCLSRILVAIKKLSGLGYSKAIIATDHGFHLRSKVHPGDKVEKPSGQWLIDKDRSLVGKGAGNDSTEVFDVGKVGIRGDAEHYVVPKTLGSFIANQRYFHSGFSIQECLLPVLSVPLKATPDENETAEDGTINLSYKEGKTKKVTTRRPVVSITYQVHELFSATEGIRLRIEAIVAEEDSPVGEPVMGEGIDPATGLVIINPGQTLKIPLKMDEEFEGAFEVVVLDPETQRVLAKIKLKTDYP